ncbi:MAG: hypothetical protein AB8G05_20630 [Oligoflexales bacterium]
MLVQAYKNYFNCVVVIDDNLSRSKVWISFLRKHFPNVRHFYTVEAALGEFELTSVPEAPILWLLDEYYYNHPISKGEIKRLLKIKSEADLFVSISRRPRYSAYFDHTVGDEPRPWEELRKQIGH